jgi:Reverse transcriptase (RNA-dependent DNA polymerase)
MSVAFDTVAHTIVLDWLGTFFGINGTTLAWLRSFLTGRKQQVFFNSVLSLTVYVTTGIPQGSVLGLLLFLVYSAEVPVIADLHGLGVHCYANDGQIYVFDNARMVAKVSACIERINLWMTTKRLKLNSEKTQFVWLGSRQQLLKVNVVSVQLGGYSVQSDVCSLAVHIDSQLTMRIHVQHISWSSFYQLLRSICPLLSETSSSALAHAFVISRLEYCNSLLAGIGDGLIAQLQSVIRVAAHLVLPRRKFDPISADLQDHLHSLPIRSRIDPWSSGLQMSAWYRSTLPL